MFSIKSSSFLPGWPKIPQNYKNLKWNTLLPVATAPSQCITNYLWNTSGFGDTSSPWYHPASWEGQFWPCQQENCIFLFKVSRHQPSTVWVTREMPVSSHLAVGRLTYPAALSPCFHFSKTICKERAWNMETEHASLPWTVLALQARSRVRGFHNCKTKPHKTPNSVWGYSCQGHGVGQYPSLSPRVDFRASSLFWWAMGEVGSPVKNCWRKAKLLLRLSAAMFFCFVF